jgi:hypothetical protein
MAGVCLAIVWGSLGLDVCFDLHLCLDLAGSYLMELG